MRESQWGRSGDCLGLRRIETGFAPHCGSQLLTNPRSATAICSPRTCWKFAGEKSGSAVGRLREPRSRPEQRTFDSFSARKRFRMNGLVRSVRGLPKTATPDHRGRWSPRTCARETEERSRNAGPCASGRVAIPISPLHLSALAATPIAPTHRFEQSERGG